MNVGCPVILPAVRPEEGKVQAHRRNRWMALDRIQATSTRDEQVRQPRNLLNVAKFSSSDRLQEGLVAVLFHQMRPQSTQTPRRAASRGHSGSVAGKRRHARARGETHMRFPRSDPQIYARPARQFEQVNFITLHEAVALQASFGGHALKKPRNRDSVQHLHLLTGTPRLEQERVPWTYSV